MAGAGLEIFAVEDTSIQVCWRSLPSGPVTVEAGGVVVEADATGGPGAATCAGLSPGTDVDVHVTAGGRRHHAGQVRTLVPPPGRELYRFVTLNDLHIGEKAFGYLHTMRERSSPPVAYPERCARAALSEARAWGAQRLVLKGDITDQGSADQWAIAGRIAADSGLPTNVVLGNHDVRKGSVDAAAALAPFGLEAPDGPAAVDVPGLRIVTLPTAVAGLGPGYVHAPARQKVAELVGAAPGAAFVAMHHYPQRWRVPNVYPPGITGPMAKALLDAVAEANPATLVTSGHSHRHRRHHHRHLTVAEIGSPKDYPGAWAGYVVYEGGIRQVVRRVADPDAMAWTEYTRWALLGLWGRWSPGIRSHRCFTITWPPRS